MTHKGTNVRVSYTKKTPEYRLVELERALIELRNAVSVYPYTPQGVLKQVEEALHDYMPRSER